MRDKNAINEYETDIMNLNFKEAIDLPDIETISQLADEIWRDHYMPIIGAEQVEYMLKHFQNVDAIRNQIDSGYQYFILRQKEQPLAYFATLRDASRQSLHISKIYVRSSHQRQGLGKQIITFIESYCRQQGFSHVWLTVNRHNQNAIDFYLRNKFLNTGALVQDIGAGFVMDDFKMVKKIG